MPRKTKPAMNPTTNLNQENAMNYESQNGMPIDPPATANVVERQDANFLSYAERALDTGFSQHTKLKFVNALSTALVGNLTWALRRHVLAVQRDIETGGASLDLRNDIDERARGEIDSARRMIEQGLDASDTTPMAEAQAIHDVRCYLHRWAASLCRNGILPLSFLIRGADVNALDPTLARMYWDSPKSIEYDLENQIKRALNPGKEEAKKLAWVRENQSPEIADRAEAKARSDRRVTAKGWSDLKESIMAEARSLHNPHEDDEVPGDYLKLDLKTQLYCARTVATFMGLEAERVWTQKNLNLEAAIADNLEFKELQKVAEDFLAQPAVAQALEMMARKVEG